MTDVNSFIDTNSLIGGVQLPSFSGFSTIKIAAIVILLLIVVFGGSKFVGNLFRLGAFVVLIAILFQIIKV